MSTEYLTINDFEPQLICDYFANIKRQGPGSEEVTIKALSFIKNLPDDAQIADIGCGTGGQTITLAQNAKGHITAIDIFPKFIDILNENIRQNHFENKITAEVGTMDALTFEDGQLDLIWSEGAIYNIGFEKGLNEWRKYLKTGGYIAVSEASWFTNERPAEIEDFWNNAYPEIDVISKKVEQMEKAGYEAVAHFNLPENCWTDNFYVPAIEARKIFLKKYEGNPFAEKFVASEEYEEKLYRQYSKYYGYTFYIGRKL